MSGHCFVSSKGRPPQRWHATFPEARSHAHRTFDPAALGPDSVLWLLDEADCREPVTGALAACAPRLPVAILSMAPADADALHWFRLGARAYCHALAAPRVLRRVETVLMQGGYWLGESFTALLAGAVGSAVGSVAEHQEMRCPEPLTPRECAVARAVADGGTNREVASQLEISERTVKAHLTAIFDKLGIRDRLQLAVMLNRPGVDAERRQA